VEATGNVEYFTMNVSATGEGAWVAGCRDMEMRRALNNVPERARLPERAGISTKGALTKSP
jgi:hypothetical protein